MHTIGARNVNEAYPLAMQLVKLAGKLRSSRNGPVLMLPEPLSIHYDEPRERVLFDPRRDANPFFHFMEALWMLAGHDDVAWPAQFVPRMREFSDDGTIFHGAYGYRWRKFFEMDQLDTLVKHLTRYPDSRRAVLQMWDASYDLDATSRDLPCNLMVKFEIVREALNMVVFNRSNDLILGALGANVVHFSMLQEYLANRLGVRVGWYEQVSANAHVYVEEWDNRGFGQETFISGPFPDEYVRNLAEPYMPKMVDTDLWDQELQVWLDDPMVDDLESEFLSTVATPLYMSHRAYKKKEYEAAEAVLEDCTASDWQLAALQWIQRRKARVFSAS
jgi:hypothetical protein